MCYVSRYMTVSRSKAFNFLSYLVVFCSLIVMLKLHILEYAGLEKSSEM